MPHVDWQFLAVVQTLLLHNQSCQGIRTNGISSPGQTMPMLLSQDHIYHAQAVRTFATLAQCQNTQNVANAFVQYIVVHWATQHLQRQAKDSIHMAILKQTDKVAAKLHVQRHIHK